MSSQGVRAALRTIVVGAAALGAATVTVAYLQDGLGVANPSSIYVLAVAAVALVGGRIAVLVAAVLAFLLYDFLLVAPRHTFTVADPSEWVNLVLLLAVGLLVGELAALLRFRQDAALARERQARALFSVSRELATRPSTLEVLPRIVAIVVDQAHLTRAWISLEDAGAIRRVVADTGTDEAPAEPPGHRVLRRSTGNEPAEWVAIHTGKLLRRERIGPSTEAYRVPIMTGERVIGSLWAVRRRDSGHLGPVETRLLAVVADQVGQALELDRLAATARDAEVARRSDDLKSALLESVSHDLRTPLASIRAAAGSLADVDVELAADDRRATAELIDQEAEYLNRIVTNLLDLSRVEAGALRVERDAYVLADLLEGTIERARRRLQDRRLEVFLRDAPPVDIDAVLVDQVVANLLDNATKHTPPGSLIRIAAAALPGEELVRVTVEDAGPGVPDATLPNLFDKFYRVPGRSGGSRGGTGIGLAVVRGLTEALGGRVAARRSALGGLAVDVDLPAARWQAEPGHEPPT